MNDQEKPASMDSGQGREGAGPGSVAEDKAELKSEKLRQYGSAWLAKADALAQKEAEPAKTPEPKPGPIRQLTTDDLYGGGPRLRDLDADIESELKASLGGLSDKDLYGEPSREEQKKAHAQGSQTLARARVIAMRGPDVFLEVPGERNQGLLPLQQFPDGPPALGSEVEVEVKGYDQDNGLLLLARKGAAVHADWSSVAVGMTVEARVTSTNKGGLSVDVNGIRGFMPISQIDLYRIEDTEQFVNQKLLCLVAEVNPAERNLVVSRRAFLEKERGEAREKLWQELAEGQVRDGVVRSVKDFGAFVDLGGVDGLLHVSEMSWSRVHKASDFLQPGQTVKVVVLKIDPDTRKVGLGLKQLTASPWDTAGQNYPPHTIVKGKVTRLMEFGAFVELEPGVEGLVHVSELAPQRVRRVGEVVQPGQEVLAMVLNVDSRQKRIALSLKAAVRKEVDQPAEEEVEAETQIQPTRTRTIPLRGGLGND
jgi:small subunit ribosomal protein S1